MGFFSWTCAKTHLPLLAEISWGGLADVGEIACSAVLVGPRGVEARGRYDGYGRLGALDMVAAGWDLKLDAGEAVLVLDRWYAGETRADIPGRSEVEPWQGHFHDDDFIRELFAAGPLPSFDAYVARRRGSCATPAPD